MQVPPAQDLSKRAQPDLAEALTTETRKALRTVTTPTALRVLEEGAPSGYVSGELAKEACANAEKRLCKEDEWVTACRGQAQTPFP